jgi:hypothetical protein
LHLTPLCGPKIAAILKSGSDPHVFPIYECGAGEAQGVRRFRERGKQTTAFLK